MRNQEKKVEVVHEGTEVVYEAEVVQPPTVDELLTFIGGRTFFRL